MLEFLFKSQKAEISLNDDLIIKTAVQNNNFEGVKLILTQPGYDTTRWLEAA